MNSTATKIGLFVLGLLPTLFGLILAFKLWLSPSTAPQDWSQPIWSVVVLCLVSLLAFIGHALNNKRLERGELDYWITQFIFLLPFGMMSYWHKYLWLDLE